jgi:hypothetical protein
MHISAAQTRWGALRSGRSGIDELRVPDSGQNLVSGALDIGAIFSPRT